MKNLSKRDRILVILTCAMVIYMIVGLIAKNVFHIDSYTPPYRTPTDTTPTNPPDTSNIIIEKDSLYIVHGDTIKDIEEKVYNLTIRIQGNEIIGVKLGDIEKNTQIEFE